MKKIIYTILILFTLIIALGINFYRKNLRGALPAFLPPSQDIANLTDFPLNLPNGYTMSIFAKDLQKPRVLTKDQNGTLVTSITKEGRVVALPDANKDGKADRKIIIAQNLNNPHGLVFEKNKLYIAETDQVSSYDYDPQNFAISNKKKLLDLPSGGNHFTRTLLLKDNNLLISTGSSCNVCVEKNKLRATIHLIPKDGGEPTLFASGLRNAVFMELHPTTGDVWVTEMGRDLLGDDTPPDEINIIKETGKFFGWPYCYGKNIQDTSFDNSPSAKSQCQTAQASHIDLQAHSAPLGLAFLNPNELLVAYHGSWNRTVPTGYKIMKFTLDNNGNEISRENFITGWIKENNDVLGRPVDIFVNQENDIYISDDKAGVIYLLQQLD